MRILEVISEVRRNIWLDNINMRHNSRKMWGLIRSLGSDPKTKPAQTTVTPDPNPITIK